MDYNVGVCAVALNLDANIAKEKEAAEVALSFENFEGVERFVGLEEEFVLDHFGACAGVAFYGDGADVKRGSRGERWKQAQVDKKRRAQSAERKAYVLTLCASRFALCFI